MNRRPRVTGSEVVETLKTAGFAVLRIKGSHYFMSHGDGRRTVIPVHSSDTLGPGLLLKILRDCGIEMRTFENLLKR